MVKRMIIAVVLAVGIIGTLYGATMWKVKAKVKPTKVIVAKHDIPPHTKITKEMLNFDVIVPVEGIPPNALLKEDDIVGKYTQVDYGIPKNGYFFKEKVVTEQQLLDAERMKLKDGERLWTMQADIIQSAAGNIVPGVKVDVWISAKGADREVIAGKLLRNVLVVGAKDRKANDVVHQNTSSQEPQTEREKAQSKDRYASVIQLAVKDEDVLLLEKATLIGDIRLIPQSGPVVVLGDEQNDVVNNKEEDEKSTEEIQKWIMEQ